SSAARTARSTRPSAAAATGPSRPPRSEPLLSPVASERVGVEVPDVGVACGAVQPLGVRLVAPGVQAGDRVAEAARLVLQRAQQLLRDAATARLRHDVHALDLAGPV